MIDGWTIGTIVLMASATYLTRIGGYLVLGGRTLSPRVLAVLETAPGCVLLSVIAPFFVSGRVADMVALALTGLAAARLPLLPTVLIGIGSAAVMRSILG
ncbi:MAG: AzlD family protein [Proteobacteria bacterium]|nr:AzlD family protein [Pseudomonadota bacterium]